MFDRNLLPPSLASIKMEAAEIPTMIRLILKGTTKYSAGIAGGV